MNAKAKKNGETESLETTMRKHEELFQRLDLTITLQLLTG